MQRPIHFKFSGHSGVAGMFPTACPRRKKSCGVAALRYDGQWLMCERCADFVALGPNVEHPGCEAFPESVECAADERPWWKKLLGGLFVKVTNEKGLNEAAAPAPARTGSFAEQQDPGATVVEVGGKIPI